MCVLLGWEDVGILPYGALIEAVLNKNRRKFLLQTGGKCGNIGLRK